MSPCPITSTKPINPQRCGQQKPWFLFVATPLSRFQSFGKSPAIHPGFKIHHHQSQRRRPNVAGMPFRTPSVFLFLRIRHHGRKGGRPWLGQYFFGFTTHLTKLPKKTCQQKWFALIVSWVFWLTFWTSRMMRISQRKTMACSRTSVRKDLRGEKTHGNNDP